MLVTSFDTLRLMYINHINLPWAPKKIKVGKKNLEIDNAHAWITKDKSRYEMYFCH